MCFMKQKTGSEGKEEIWARVKGRVCSGQAEFDDLQPSREGTQEGETRSVEGRHREEAFSTGMPQGPLSTKQGH